MSNNNNDNNKAQVVSTDDTEPSLSKQCIAEGAGTFFLVLCVLVATGGQGWLVATGLLVIIVVFGPAANGGHFNPAITAVAYAKKDVDGKVAVSKVVSQIIGGLLAFAVWYAFYGSVKQTSPTTTSSSNSNNISTQSTTSQNNVSSAVANSTAFAF